MAVHTVRVTQYVVDPVTGVIEILYTFDGQTFDSVVYPDIATMVRLSIDPIDSQAKGIAMALAWWLSRDPTAANPIMLVGHTITIDFADPVPIKAN